MRYIVLTLALVGFVGCGDMSADEPVEVKDGVLIVVKPGPGPAVSCSLQGDGWTCDCTMSECGEAALNAAAEQCFRLRHPIVIE